MTDLADYRHVVARDHVRLERCVACGRHRVQPMPSCPWCGEAASTVVDFTASAYHLTTTSTAPAPPAGTAAPAAAAKKEEETHAQKKG